MIKSNNQIEHQVEIDSLKREHEDIIKKMKSKHEKKVEKLSYKFQIMLDSKVEQIETQASENISDMQRVY